jgi:transposase
MFSYVSPEARVPAGHPLRPIRAMVDVALRGLSPSFDALYKNFGRPSIAPEKLLRALLLQVLYSVRSERMLMEQLEYNLLFRWFVGLNMDDAVWVPTVFSKNRDRLLDGDIAQKFFAQVLEQAREANLTSDEHFSVDGTLIEAWAGQKSFQRKEQTGEPPADTDDPGNPTVNFHSETRRNDTHESKTDPEALLARKGSGKEARLSFCGNVLIENRNGLVVDAELRQATGTAERDAAAAMAENIGHTERVTIAGDKGYDTKDFVAALRSLNVTPHVAQNGKRRGGSAIDGRTTRHEGYQISQRKRKRIEEVFGWMKTVGMLRKTRHRGVSRVGWMFTFTASAYNLVRMRTLLPAAVQTT